MRYVAGLAALVCLSQSVSAEPFHHSSGEWREYHRDWLAACPAAIDEDGPDFYSFSCFASTGSQAQNSAALPAYKLTLILNRLDGALDIAVTVAADDAIYDEARPMVLKLSGEPPISLAMRTDIETRYNTINQYFVVDAELRARLVDLMKDRAALTLAVPLEGRPAPVETRLSLQGVMAALDFMTTNSRRVAQY
ncbi:hypothetical protein [Devosia sp. FJ2-5-3]|jgi:invasion protein IalB|uniref:hypothetical protein n=1 Tax=Devosia sp. FJ2-5-3 TaxID=2976680 RepID=UPI0023D86233|nr:hypothetical protein [Devosia sp. FJ2-5-3]WEJ57706.1 hypothetical protein N0P34_16110 [Devosia sp. FJ2-5-3]